MDLQHPHYGGGGGKGAMSRVKEQTTVVLGTAQLFLAEQAATQLHRQTSWLTLTC
jgi:hypothetical protein